MRRMLRFLVLSLLLSAWLAAAQTPPPSQTARQALIEMFFGTAPDHLERHLTDQTRKMFKKMQSANGPNVLEEFSMFAATAKSGGTKFETFDAGPVLVEAESGDGSRVEITVEGDNLSGEEDDIELALHITKDGQEQKLPIVPRFTFAMQSAANVWRLNEISVTARVPLADPDFLKSIEDQQNRENEQLAESAITTILNAQSDYRASHGTYACSLKELSASPPDLAAGKRAGYVFAISGCEGAQYKVVAEPEAPDSGQRAFCSDETGTMRAAMDGKATTCLLSGEAVESAGLAGGFAAQSSQNSENPASPQAAAPRAGRRVRVSQQVSQAMLISKVQPLYPPDALRAHVQGTVVLGAVIGKDGTVQDLRVVSGHPMLTGAALEAVRQWKFRPYVLNGSPVEVDTQLSVDFILKLK